MIISIPDYQKKKSPILPLIITLLVLVAIGIVVFLLLVNQPQSTLSDQDDVKTPPAPTAASTRLLLTGTTFWGRRTNKLARASELGVAYPFSQLSTLQPEQYNAWIGNLECPVTDNGHDPYNEDTLLKFNCDPDYLPEAAKYFKAFSLGTNHVDNWGPEGIATTKQNLKQNHIQSFGSTEYNDGKNNCNLIAIPANITFDNGEHKTINLPLGFCSAHGVFGIPTTEVVANIENYAKVVPTIVMPHMGAEYKAEADDIRTNLYHNMIDVGAEMVVADHPHWIQNTESYQGKLITYSLGNFMFDQLFNDEVSRGAALDATATITNTDDLKNFEAWDQLAQTCQQKDGNCLTDIQSAQLKKPALNWKFDVHGTTTAGDCITRLASDAEQQSIRERLQWQATIKDLK